MWLSPEATSLVAKYEGDVSGLANANMQAIGMLDVFSRKVSATAAIAIQRGGLIAKSFRGLGGVMAALIPVLDATTASIVLFAITGTTALKTLFQTLKTLAILAKTGFIIALLAAAAAVGYLAGRLLSGAASTEKAQKALERYNKTLAGTRDALKEVSDGWDKYAKTMEQADLELRLFGDRQSWLQTKQESTKKQITAIIQSYTALRKEMVTIGNQMLSNRSEVASLERANQDIISSGDDISDVYINNSQRIKELNNQYIDLNAIWGANQTRLSSLLGDYNELNNTYNETTAALVDMAAAQEAMAQEPTEVKLFEGTDVSNAVQLLGAVNSATESAKASFYGFVASLYPSIWKLANEFANLWTGFSQGFGDAIANAIVYGDNFGKAMKELGKKLLANFISLMIQTVINTLLYGLMSLVITGGLAASRIALSAAIASAAAYAASFETFGLLGFAVGPGMAAAAAAGTGEAATAGFTIGKTAGTALGAMSVAGVGAYAEGGLFTGPTLAVIGEKGDEAVLPVERIKELLGTNGTTEVTIQLDSRTIAQATVPWIPAIVHAKGVKGI